MLKRPRAPSPSPTRPGPSTPPPLDGTVHLSFRASKRRRTFGPTLDSFERRDYNWGSDDGEDDCEREGNEEDVEEGAENEAGRTIHDKVYSHVNHILHGLHAEQQRRSHALSTNLHPCLCSQSSYACDHDSPITSTIKHDQSASSSMEPYCKCTEPKSSNGYVERGQSQNLVSDHPTHKGLGGPRVQDDERLRVTNRYEDTNRLLGSLVLNRRRTLEIP